jgi:hypothetical protein
MRHETLATHRFFDGFTLNEMVSEYRALRATVVRLWLANTGAGKQDGLYELIRFQEGIDQALAESIERFSYRLSRSRELFMGIWRMTCARHCK